MRWLPLFVALAGCAPEYDVVGLVGGDGVLRFNLVFSNPETVDLDLHVVTPGDEEIWYAELDDETGGELDVDCLCGDCPQGPNENVFWSYSGEAAQGSYEVSVVYYGACEIFDTPPSDYTLRVLESGAVIQTYNGTLSHIEDTDRYTHVYPTQGGSIPD